MEKIKYYFYIILGLTFLAAGKAQAGLLNPKTSEDVKGETQRFAGSFFNVGQKPGAIIASLIEVFLGLLGVIFVILIIYAGYNWMTANGEQEKVQKAKDTIRRAIIGLLIIAAAYAITAFVFQELPAGSGIEIHE